MRKYDGAVSHDSDMNLGLSSYKIRQNKNNINLKNILKITRQCKSIWRKHQDSLNAELAL